MAERRRIGKYEILEEIGRGGFAVVHKARDTELDREVALKVLHPQLTVNLKFVERFKREARTAARLEHPHMVTVYDAAETDGQLYILPTPSCRRCSSQLCRDWPVGRPFASTLPPFDVSRD